MSEHITIHPAYSSANPVEPALEALRVFVSPPSANATPTVTVDFKTVGDVQKAYSKLHGHLSDLSQVSLDLAATQPKLSYSLELFETLPAHLAILSDMGVSRIALPFIADSMKKVLTRSRQAHESALMGQKIIGALETSRLQ